MSKKLVFINTLIHYFDKEAMIFLSIFLIAGAERGQFG